MALWYGCKTYRYSSSSFFFFSTDPLGQTQYASAVLLWYIFHLLSPLSPELVLAGCGFFLSIYYIYSIFSMLSAILCKNSSASSLEKLEKPAATSIPYFQASTAFAPPVPVLVPV